MSSPAFTSHICACLLMCVAFSTASRTKKPSMKRRFPSRKSSKSFYTLRLCAIFFSFPKRQNLSVPKTLAFFLPLFFHGCSSSFTRL